MSFTVPKIINEVIPRTRKKVFPTENLKNGKKARTIFPTKIFIEASVSLIVPKRLKCALYASKTPALFC